MPLSLPTPSAETLTRPRIVVALISAAAAVSFGYYAYLTTVSSRADNSGSGLHRSNAVRRNRRSNINETTSSSSDDHLADENAENILPPILGGDGETVVGAAEEWWNDPQDFPPAQRAGHNIVNLLFRVSEDNARRNGYVHRGCQCNACGMVPIRGVRYRCANCADFDLCETCEAQGVHIKTHIFYKIRVPAPPFGPRQMQPVWYTGDPDTCRRQLPRNLISKFCGETGFERPEMEAIWEQWTFMANTEFRDDPDQLGLAMDRKTFERCLVPTGGSRHTAPNLIHDRMFHFYDRNKDDLISFREFVHGLAYRNRKDKLHKVFEGYDLDEDGYVDRKDFLRMFRAYYVLFKQMHKDILEGLEDQLMASTEASQLVASRQPLSSLFGREGRVPPAEGGYRAEGKTVHSNGRVDVADGYESAIIDDQGDTATRQEILTSLFAWDSARSRHNFAARTTNGGWQTVRRMSDNEADRAYWVTLLEPPTNLDALPDIIRVNPNFDDLDDLDDDDGEEQDDGDGGEARDSATSPNGEPANESEKRAETIARDRRREPKLERRRRDMARAALHERWKRREFYLDEEEGGSPPEDWDDEEDLDLNGYERGESSKSAMPSYTNHRRHSGDWDSYPVKGRRSKRSRGDYDDIRSSDGSSYFSEGPFSEIEEELNEVEDIFGEHDAGREILYQVTQQAFNELLDTIFRPGEDIAIKAAETKADREDYRDLIDEVDLLELIKSEPVNNGQANQNATDDDPLDQSLEDLLEDMGYTVDEPGRNAVELESGQDHTAPEGDTTDKPASTDLATNGAPAEYRDPTMPQFRPDGVSASESPPEDPAEPEGPTREQLIQWKHLTFAEEQANARGGWGKLNFAEFEVMYQSQENLGNRLDYLGSWIDFCIP